MSGYGPVRGPVPTGACPGTVRTVPQTYPQAQVDAGEKPVDSSANNTLKDIIQLEICEVGLADVADR